MNLTPAQLTDLRGIVAERIGAPEITEDTMICPACGGDDYGPTVQVSQLAYYVYNNLLPSYLRGVCCSVTCGYVRAPASLYVVQVTTAHVRDLYRAPKGSVLWLNYPPPDGGLPFLEIVHAGQALRPTTIGYRETLRYAVRNGNGLRARYGHYVELWQGAVGALFPPF